MHQAFQIYILPLILKLIMLRILFQLTFKFKSELLNGHLSFPLPNNLYIHTPSLSSQLPSTPSATETKAKESTSE